LITFLSPENATPINIHVPFFIITYNYVHFLLGMVLSDRISSFHNILTFISWLFNWFWYMLTQMLIT
jgi:hypothetical protein